MPRKNKKSNVKKALEYLREHPTSYAATHEILRRAVVADGLGARVLPAELMPESVPGDETAIAEAVQALGFE